MKTRPWRAILVVAAMAIPAVAEDHVFVETFDDDPVAAGRFLVRGEASRFVHAPGESMTASYDTLEPTAILYHPLPEPVGACTDFSLEVDLTILSDGFYADESTMAQIAFGLINTEITGDVRIGDCSGQYAEVPDAFAIITIDYYPNESSLWGGPSLGPTLVNTDDGGSFCSALEFTFGNETDMTTEGPLPLDVPLTFRLESTCHRDTGEQTLTVTVDGPNGPILINTEGDGAQAGGPDGDPTTIQTTASKPLLVVDALAITLWEDTFLFGPPASLVADVRFDEMRLVVSGPPPVPTVSEWGMMLFALMIMATGAVIVFRTTTARKRYTRVASTPAA